MPIWLIVVICIAGALLLVLVAALLLAAAEVGPWRFGSPDLVEVREAADQDAAAVREADRHFRRDAPGNDPDDL